MSDAYHIEPSVPGGGAVVQGLDSPAASAAKAGTGRRISASSFKLLTAKLKKAPLPELLALQPVAEAAPLPVEVQAAEPSAVELPIEAALPEVMAEAEPQPAALPEFQPIDFYVPKAEPVIAEDEQSAEPDLPVHAEPELLTSFTQSLLPDSPLPEFVLAPMELAAAEPEISAAPEAELLPEPEPEVIVPDAEPFLEAATGIDEEAAVVEAPEQEELVAATEVAAVEVAAVEEQSWTPELIAEFEAVVPETVQVEPEIAIVEPETSQAEPETAQAEPETLGAEPETVQAAPEPVTADALAEEEAKSPKSDLAGRVVDAMIKTISTAVYAKPSAAERAAFLREMAEIMEQEAAANGEPAPAAPEPVINAVHQPAPMPIMEDAPIADALASRMGPAAALLKPKAEQEEDPFAQNLGLSLLIDPKPQETLEADEESGELAITLLDMMSGGSGTALPHERTLAADTLLRILPRIPVKQLLAVVERVAIMETPPALLVAKLIRDPRHEVVGPLLERCSHISDQDLMNAAPDGDAPKLRMIARRRILSTVLSDYLISVGEPGVLLTLIRNPGAALSHDAFFKLAEFATRHHGLLAPLATRADLPSPVAFELFWHVPQELRRFIFSRFLTDSETLNKILRITLATHADASTDVIGEGKFPSREAIEIGVEHAAHFRLDEASRQFAEIGSIAKDTAMRILSDREGEPITVLFKALGYPRSKFEEALARLRHSDSGILRPDRNPEEMQAIFDGLSFNKARILLTYWDWFVRKAGPYSPHN